MKLNSRLYLLFFTLSFPFHLRPPGGSALASLLTFTPPPLVSLLLPPPLPPRVLVLGVILAAPSPSVTCFMVGVVQWSSGPVYRLPSEAAAPCTLHLHVRLSSRLVSLVSLSRAFLSFPCRLSSLWSQESYVSVRCAVFQDTEPAATRQRALLSSLFSLLSSLSLSSSSLSLFFSCLLLLSFLFFRGPSFGAKFKTPYISIRKC